MWETQHDTREGDTVHTQISLKDASPLREHRPRTTIHVTLCDVDLPAFFSDGVLYVQAPLSLVFEAFAEDLPAFVRDMEIGISDSRGRPLPFDRHWFTVPGEGMAKPRVVRRGRKS